MFHGGGIMKKFALAMALILCLGTLVACGGGEKAPALKDGTYTASAEGYSDDTPVDVEVTVAEGKISAVSVTNHGESVDDIPEVAEALETGYIAQDDVEVLHQWRKDPANWNK